MEKLSLQKILEAFTAPLNEEQAWAVCYQCAKYFVSSSGIAIDRSSDQEDIDDGQTDGSIDRILSTGKPKSFVNGLASSAGDDSGNLSEALSSQSHAGVIPAENKTRATGSKTRPAASEMVNSHLLLLGPDGNVSSVTGFTSSTWSPEFEKELVRSLGVMIFQALDYGLSETEEQRLSPALEELIGQMTNSDAKDRQGDRDGEGDEGIEDDNDDKDSDYQPASLSHVIQVCGDHVEASGDACSHYKAVCRALVAEAIELTTFLEKIYTERERMQMIPDESNEDCLHHLEALQRTDWARLWMQIMKELRQGVKLKKVQSTVTHPVEYEMTPYEILMDDVRYRRYTLNKVLLDDDMMPQKVKKDVHEIILQFIRSRPPLHPVNSRRLSSPPIKSPDVREQLLLAIRSEPQLKPTPGRIVETSRTKLNESDSTPRTSKKIIKPDLTLFMSNSFDDDCENDSDDDDDKNRVTAAPLTPFTPLSPKSPPRHLPWQQTDITKKDPRRNSITVCQSPSSPSGSNSPLAVETTSSNMVSIQSQVDKFMAADFTNIRTLQSSLECLSLTVEEVMHIRNVLTKAELECLSVDPELYAQLASGKVCFNCKKTKFSLFGTWSTTCKFCHRNVCTHCVRKMRIPTEHFEHIPVYTLSPSPGSPLNDVDSIYYDASGSVPTSPDFSRKSSKPETELELKTFATNVDVAKSTEERSVVDVALGNNRSSRAPLQRAQTSVRPPSSFLSRSLEGPMMNVCRDCRAMVVNVIKASRRSLAMAPQGNAERVYSSCPSRKPSRNFHLDLKPVYKEH